MDGHGRLTRDGYALALGGSVAAFLVAMFLPAVLSDDRLVLVLRVAVAGVGLAVAIGAYRTWPSRGTTALLVGAWAVGLGVSACLAALDLDGAGAIGAGVTLLGFLAAVYVSQKSSVG
jgi:hypothetical protein